MDKTLTEQCYQPLSQSVQIGAREYAVVDPAVAEERATHYLQQAQAVLEQLKTASQAELPTLQADIEKKLLIAIDLGSVEGPFLLAQVLLDEHFESSFSPQEAVLFTKIAAERGHREACQQMASCYADQPDFPALVAAGQEYFSEISPKDKSMLAQYYTQQADDC